MWGKPVPRPTIEQMREVGDIIVSLAEVEFDTQSEELVTVWWPLKDGGVQPVFWPLPPHQHEQECFRA